MNRLRKVKMVLARRVVSISVGVLLAGTLRAAPAVYVASTGDHSTGADWASAYTDIQTAIDAVDNGGTIFLKGETFSVTSQLEMIGGSNVTIRGGYEGVGSPGAHDPAAWPTVIRMAHDYTNRVFYLEGVTNGTLEDIHVTGGNKTGVSFGDAGGGLCLSNNVSVTLRGIIITNNLAEKSGGGLAIIGRDGSHSGPTVMENCTLVGNRVVSPSGTSPYGGGLYAYYAKKITMNDCRVISNNADGSGPSGGGMYLLRVNVDATGTLLADNWLSGSGAFRGGGATVSSWAYLNLMNSVVRNNRCVGGSKVAGAGINTDSSATFFLRNSLFSGNVAQGGTSSSGGAIYYSTGNNLTADNCTFVGNQPEAVARPNVNGLIILNNCILWDNNGRDIVDSGTIVKTTAFTCDIQDGFNNGTNGCISVDPLFMRPSVGDYGLRTDSPCRELGTSLSWHNLNTLDLAGNPRVMPKHGTVDMGAFEGMPVMATLLLMR